MSLTAFIRKHRDADAPYTTLLSNAVDEFGSDRDPQPPSPPTHIPDQRDLIRDAFDTDSPVWIFVFDAGRYDIFDQLAWDYVDGQLQRAWNGGVGYTGDWAVRNLTGEFGDRGLFSYVPLRGFGAADYDGREHFAVAPEVNHEFTVQERLAELGYRQRTTDEQIEISPQAVNAAVRDRRGGLNGGLIRYLKPHPPFEGLEDLTSERSKTLETQQALDTGTLTYDELTAAYIDTYHTAFQHAVELIPELPGRIILTADHGTCLTCGQLFHGRRLDKHDHLTIVPWMEVSGLR